MDILYQPKTTRSGEISQSTEVFLDFEHPPGTGSRLPAPPVKRDAQAFGRAVEHAIKAKTDGDPLPGSFWRTLGRLPAKYVQSLVDIGLLTAEQARVGHRLVDRLGIYKVPGTGQGSAAAETRKARRLIMDLADTLDWYDWDDVDPGALRSWFNDLSLYGARGNRCFNPKAQGWRQLNAFLGFARWMAGHQGGSSAIATEVEALMATYQEPAPVNDSASRGIDGDSLTAAHGCGSRRKVKTAKVAKILKPLKSILPLPRFDFNASEITDVVSKALKLSHPDK